LEKFAQRIPMRLNHLERRLIFSVLEESESDLSPRTGGCFAASAYLLEHYEFKGSIFWVESIHNFPVYHAYVVLDAQNPQDFALNHADNGYIDFKKLTCAQARDFGENKTQEFLDRFVFGDEQYFREKWGPRPYHQSRPYRKLRTPNLNLKPISELLG
jgi:hypothetical protein